MDAVLAALSDASVAETTLLKSSGSASDLNDLLSPLAGSRQKHAGAGMLSPVPMRRLEAKDSDASNLSSVDMGVFHSIILSPEPPARQEHSMCVSQSLHHQDSLATASICDQHSDDAMVMNLAMANLSDFETGSGQLSKQAKRATPRAMKQSMKQPMKQQPAKAHRDSNVHSSGHTCTPTLFHCAMPFSLWLL